MFSSVTDESKGVYFVCQKCRKALKVTNGIKDPSIISSFRSSLPLPEHLKIDYQQKEKEALDRLAESFVVLNNNNNNNNITENKDETEWFEQMEALTKVFEVISDKCQLDHPLCTSCVDEVNKQLHERIKKANETYKLYEKTLSEFQSSEKTQLPKTTVDLTEEQRIKEETLRKELLKLQQQRESLKIESVQLRKQELQLDEYEQRFWKEYQDFQNEKSKTLKNKATAQQRVETAQVELERLRRTNVFDDAFHIYYDGHFGTINGFRLGRLPSQPVDWDEISASLGQVLLLLRTLADHCNFKFSKYRLLPMGSFSKIAKLSDLNTAYELYGSQDFSVGKLFWYRRFDTALVWLLECIQEFGEYAASMDNNFKLKYPIEGHMIGGHSVKMQFNNDASWTKAMKYLLTNLKFLLAWTIKHKDH